jgi:VCBS repeat-containing protein
VSTFAQHQVFLAFKAQGTWVYGLSKATQEQIARLLAGKTTHEAEQILAALPGVEQASIRFSGFGDASRLPKQDSLIHLTFLVTG